MSEPFDTRAARDLRGGRAGKGDRGAPRGARRRRRAQSRDGGRVPISAADRRGRRGHVDGAGGDRRGALRDAGAGALRRDRPLSRGQPRSRRTYGRSSRPRRRRSRSCASSSSSTSVGCRPATGQDGQETIQKRSRRRTKSRKSKRRSSIFGTGTRRSRRASRCSMGNRGSCSTRDRRRPTDCPASTT